MRRCVLLILWILVGRVLAGEVQSSPSSKTVTDVLKGIPVQSPEPLWDTVAELTALGEAARPELESRIENADPVTTVVIGSALLRMGSQRIGTLGLERVILNPDAPEIRRLDAAAAMGAYGGPYTVTRLRALLQKDLPDLYRAAVAQALWRLTHGGTAYEELCKIVQNSTSPRARALAALALGRAGRIAESEAVLTQLADLPGEMGDAAREVLENNRRLKRMMEKDSFAGKLISEIIQVIRTKYTEDESDPLEKEQLQPENLATAAARGMVTSLDDFNDYLDEESYKDMLEQMRADYGGIGAWVGMRNGRFTILTPMYGQPAYQAGICSMDVVVKINGEEIKDLPLDKIIKRLKGPPGTTVTLSILRQGWDEPQDRVVTRAIIEIPLVLTQNLPGGIGYIRLNGFNEDPDRNRSSSASLRDALAEMKKEGVRGILLDLRNNPGGLLSEAVKVASLFLPGGVPVVSSRGKEIGNQPYYAEGRGAPFYEGPLVVLLNEGSASASEIVAGALRDHKRAKLVGQKSFGKGSVQQLLPLSTTQGRTRLKLTIAKYYLPSGECIHGRNKGIQPDVPAEEPEIPLAERKARWVIQDGRTIEDWLASHFSQHADEFRRLLVFDQYTPDAYPDFSDLMSFLATRHPDIQITPEMARKELRTALFRYLTDKCGEKGYVIDIQESEVIQRALLVLAESFPEKRLPDLPLYNAFRDKFVAKEAIAVKKEKTGATASSALENE